MFQPTEQDERRYLKQVLSRLQKQRDVLQEQIDAAAEQVLEMKRQIWEEQGEMDTKELVASRINVSDEMDRGEEIIREAKRIDKLILSPYFGRIDFNETGASNTQNIYLGIHAFGTTDSSYAGIHCFSASRIL